ncbi:MAG: DUF6702 family protein [Pseudomonadota bacterium]
MTLLLRLALVLLAGILAMPAAAHQQKESVTRVVFNARTGNIEVMHRFLLHDAEHASRELLGGSPDLLGNAADRGRFERYVHGRFALVDQDGAAIALKPVGNEIEHQFLWVYAEAPMPDSLTAMTVSHHALRDVWPEQTNLVNVERGGSVRSATFFEGSGAIEIRF